LRFDLVIGDLMILFAICEWLLLKSQWEMKSRNRTSENKISNHHITNRKMTSMGRTTSLAVFVVCSLTVTSGQRGVLPPRHDLVGKVFDARIVRVADGDTVEAIASGESRPIRIRLLGVDAPETGEVFSRDAQALLRSLLFDQRVRAEGRDIDRYNRLVARITVGGKDASEELLRLGLACYAYARDTGLARAEALARVAGRGFWSATAQKPACVQRQIANRDRSAGSAGSSTTMPRVAAGYRGNVSSGVYHATWCPNFNCRNCTRLFSTEAEAKAAGFRPAADCAQRQR
jgi:endonuclease YncB( thermonuclease family)